MKISLDWLSDFVAFHDDWRADPAAVDTIAERITTGVAEIDEVEMQGKYLNKCCVGKVLTLRKHPNADKLSLCTVQTDDGVKNIVCGGTNLREGMRVAFAHIGAKVQWHGEDEMTLEKCKIRGEESEGMICAAEELAIDHIYPEAVGHTIVDLGDGDDDVGMPLKEYLGLSDVILHVDNHAITQRPDLFSHVGFARECVALGLGEWKQKPEYTSPSFPDNNIPFKTINDIPDLIPRYFACLLEIDAVGETPEFIKRRLEATGWRSINLPIDITNYVSMEVGMPLHSFDADDFDGDITMRIAQAGETITTLDEVERDLPEGAIVISDKQGIFDLLGIMGGLRSSTKNSTRKIYLHSAIVDPVSIRKTVIATGHRTDAATTYEKGVPYSTAQYGFYRALELFLDHVPGARIVSKEEERGSVEEKSKIEISVEEIDRKIGVSIPPSQVVDILTNLECDVEQNGDMVYVVSPSFRRDLNGSHDLVEEIGRIVGYNNIEECMPSASIAPPHRDHRRDQFRGSLKELGFFELIPLSLLGPSLLIKARYEVEDAPVVLDPIGEELSLMQPSVLPRLLEYAQQQLRHSDGYLQTFHIGNVFSRKNGESTQCGMLVCADEPTDVKNDPFWSMKHHCSKALSVAGFHALFKQSSTIPSQAHPGRCADVVIDGTCCGQIFEVHPAIRANFSLEHRAVAVLLNFSRLMNVQSQIQVCTSLPQYPAVSYDVTIPFSLHNSVETLLSKAREQSELLESIEAIDVYQSQEGAEYNLTLRATYRSHEKTLKEAEAQQEHEKVVASLQ